MLLWFMAVKKVRGRSCQAIETLSGQPSCFSGLPTCVEKCYNFPV